jgi:hypothetical protein
MNRDPCVHYRNVWTQDDARAEPEQSVLWPLGLRHCVRAQGRPGGAGKPQTNSTLSYSWNQRGMDACSPRQHKFTRGMQLTGLRAHDNGPDATITPTLANLYRMATEAGNALAAPSNSLSPSTCMSYAPRCKLNSRCCHLGDLSHLPSGCELHAHLKTVCCLPLSPGFILAASCRASSGGT